MRKVTAETVKAFIAGRSRTVGNTTTDGTVLLLHGNRIAERLPNGSIVATLSGWGSVTTRERLNGLCQELGLGRLFHQSKHVQYFRDAPVSVNDTVVLVEPKNWEVACV
jgi:hypothetical protein